MTTTELDELRPVLEAELARLHERIAAIQVLLNGNGPQHDERGGRGRIRGSGDGRAPARASGVSEARVQAVREILEANGECRQREITEALMNALGISEGNASGTTSNALRVGTEQGWAQRTGRTVNKSEVWRYTGPQTRATVVEPGAGTRSGRRSPASKS